MTIIDYRKAIAPMNDRANKYIVKRRNAKTLQLAMFTVTRNASWASDRALKMEGYPLATLNIPVNRNAFRLQVGDQFIFNYPHFGISGMICRVLRITEDNLESGALNVQAMEDIDHLSQDTFGQVAEGKLPIPSQALTALSDVSIIEAPFALVGDVIKVIPLAAKTTGTEIGYYLYMSFDDGASYQKIGTITSYSIHGTLSEAYGASTYKVDELTDGFLVDFDVANTAELSAIQTVTRGQMISGQNLALLGDEIITFKTVSPVTTTQYRISGIYRGRYDTERADHSIGADFWFAGVDLYQTVAHSELALGGDRKFKMVPYNNQTSGDISLASEVDYTITGRAMKPYPAGNLKANGSTIPDYKTDVVLTWSSRFRGLGAGFGNPGVVLGAIPTVEYSYTLEIEAGAVLVRTVEDLEAVTYTYTFDMNVSDNTELATDLTFKIKQVRSVNLESSQIQIDVKHDWRYPNAYALDGETSGTGDFEDIFVKDGVSWQFEEISGNPGQNIVFIFDDVPEVPLRVFMRCFYDGNPAHVVKLRRYDYDSATWVDVTEDVRDFISRSTLREYYFDLAYDADYFSNGQMKLQIDHVSSGSPGHFFDLDFMALDTQQRLYKWNPSTTTTTTSSSSTTTTTTA